MNTSPKILVVREDKLGDFVLALPCFDALRSLMPTSELTAFVPAYTQPIAELHTAVDRVLIDPGARHPQGGARALGRAWRAEKFDAVVALHLTGRIATAAWLARIPVRVGPSTKAFQFLLNGRLAQRRSYSIQPEYEYNLDLVRHFAGLMSHDETFSVHRPVLELSPERIAARRSALLGAFPDGDIRQIIAIHPGHGGSANNLSLDQYARLGRALTARPGVGLLITAGPGEAELTDHLAALLDGCPSRVFRSNEGLVRFGEVLGACDAFVGGSSGPLHLAGALDVPTCGFYVRRRTGSMLRWQTLNSEDRRLAVEPGPAVDERDMSGIDIPAAAQAILDRLLPT